jgi:hypothetical protein
VEDTGVKTKHPWIAPFASGADLSGKSLSGWNLSQADFSRANLSEADLHGSDFSEANLELASDAIDPVALGRFMHAWVRKWDYLDAVAHGEARRNLDGSPAGEPDEPQRRKAARQVYGAQRFEAVLARIAARQVPAPDAEDGA